MSSPALVALTLADPEDADAPPASAALGESEILILVSLAVVVAGVFAFDMIHTWWETTRWRREARRRRREQL